MGLAARLWMEAEGQGMVEYAFIIMLVALVLITALGTMGLMAADALQPAVTALE